jgi:uncharacterized protein
MMTDSEFEAKYRDIYNFVRSKLESAPGCHDFDHTLRVLNNAEKLALELPKADLRIVRLAALLHDIARPEEMQSKGRLCHAREGMTLAVSLLNEYGFSAEMIDHIAACIGSHRFRGSGPEPESREAQIIYDADKLDSIGAVGIGRAFHFAGRENARIHNKPEEALNSDEYSREDSAYREYLVKLRHIPGKMLTVPGKRLAAVRSQFMDEFFEQLNKEIHS